MIVGIYILSPQPTVLCRAIDTECGKQSEWLTNISFEKHYPMLVSPYSYIPPLQFGPERSLRWRVLPLHEGSPSDLS